METLLLAGKSFHLWVFTKFLLTKLSELPVSINAVTECPLICTFTTALARQSGEAAESIARVGIAAKVSLEEADLHTLEKWPFFPQLLHVVSLAGHLLRGCLLYPQKKHLVFTAAKVAVVVVFHSTDGFAAAIVSRAS